MTSLHLRTWKWVVICLLAVGDIKVLSMTWFLSQFCGPLPKNKNKTFRPQEEEGKMEIYTGFTFPVQRFTNIREIGCQAGGNLRVAWSFCWQIVLGVVTEIVGDHSPFSAVYGSMKNCHQPVFSAASRTRPVPRTNWQDVYVRPATPQHVCSQTSTAQDLWSGEGGGLGGMWLSLFSLHPTNCSLISRKVPFLLDRYGRFPPSLYLVKFPPSFWSLFCILP